MEILISVGLGVGLAAACGLRVFLPVLFMGLAARAGFLTLADGFEWMAGYPALLALGVATACEIGAYFVPWLDNLLDTVATPAAITAGTVVAAANMETATPLLGWSLATVTGGSAVAVVQTGTTMLRAASTATTGGLGNPLVSTAELVGAVGMSLLAITVPLLALATVLAVTAVVGALLLRRFGLRRARSRAD